MSSTAGNGISAVRDVAIKDGTSRRRRGRHPGVPRGQDRRRGRAVRHAGPRSIFTRTSTGRPSRSADSRADNNGRLPRWLQLPHRRDDVRRSRRLRLAQLRGLEGPGHRSLQDPRARVHQHRRPGSAGGQLRAGSQRTWKCKPTAEMALKYKGLIVGVKSAHYSGPEWDPFTARSRSARSRTFR